MLPNIVTLLLGRVLACASEVDSICSTPKSEKEERDIGKVNRALHDISCVHFSFDLTPIFFAIQNAGKSKAKVIAAPVIMQL